jgi:membrane complex biogenesis BtpA family protein
MDAITARAVEEARLLQDAGFDGLVVENFGDHPFHKDMVEPVTIAALARIVAAVVAAVPVSRVGVNVLRNDARAAVSIAAVCGARFVRVNVHVGATATDQGVIEGRAAETLRLRAALGAPIDIWADVQVKHGRSLAHAEITLEAEDAVRRGGANALIVSGAGTGRSASLDDVRRVAALRLGVPVLVGSGVDERSVGPMLAEADGVIVGTALKVGGATEAPIDRERTRRFVAAARG